jgi:hypothetical protein
VAERLFAALDVSPGRRLTIAVAVRRGGSSRSIPRRAPAGPAPGRRGLLAVTVALGRRLLIRYRATRYLAVTNTKIEASPPGA